MAKMKNDLTVRMGALVEKIAAGCFLGAIFQRQDSFGKAIFWGITMLVLCLIMQWSADKRGTK